MNIQLSDVERASARLHDVIHPIPVTSSKTFSAMSGADLYLKFENQQKTGSFKVRGAYNKIAKLAEEGKKSPVVASSAGNHAQGVAYASSQLGIKSTIVMPRSAPMAKVSATEGYGAEVVLSGDCYDDAYAKAMEIVKEQGATFIHPFNDIDVIAGQGTIALEILRDLPTVDTIVVPAGGGGLLAGVAFAAKQVNPRVRVIGVQAEGADAIVQSFQAKKLVSTESANTIADGIAVKTPGDVTVDLINQYVDEMVTVSDDEIAAAILLLLERTKQVVEPAGATPLAAALNNKFDLKGKKVVCVMSGGNIDVSFIHRVVEKGLVTRGRQMRFKTIMVDVPGSLEKFSAIAAKCNANIIMIQYDRMHAELGLDEVIMHVAVEVSSYETGMKMIKKLEKAGYKIMLESQRG